MQAPLPDLVRLAQGGDLDAFSELVARFQDFVYGLAYHASGSFEDARDLAQEAFVRAYQRLGDLREPRGFPGWLRRVTVSVCRNSLPALRRGSGRSLEEAVANGFDPPDTSAGPDRRAAEAELREAVLAAVRALPDDYGLPLTLFYLDGMSSAAVGEFLGLSSGTVKMRLHRARNMVRQELTPVFEDAFEDKRLSPEFPVEVRKWLELLEREYDRSCRLLNPEVLRFERDADSGCMMAIPSEPLRYRNDDLGYIVTVNTHGIFLRDRGPFGHRMKSETVEELEPESPEQAALWESNRRHRFMGSLPHFMYSWVHDRHEEEGFEMLEPTSGLILRPRESQPDPRPLHLQVLEFVVPGSRLRVRYGPADAEGVLNLSDGWVNLHGLCHVGGNWGVRGYWEYRSGFGLSNQTIHRELETIRRRWEAEGPVGPRPLQPPRQLYRRREGITDTVLLASGKVRDPVLHGRLCLHVMPDGETVPFWSRSVEAFCRANAATPAAVELADGWDSGHRSLLVDLRSGRFSPDIAQVPQRWLGTYVADDLLQPLDDLLPAEFLERFIAEPDLLAACRWRGRLVALPLSASVRGLFVNAAFVDSLPADWDQLVQACEAARAKGCPHGIGLELAGVEGPNLIHSLLWGHGTDLLDAAGDVVLDTPQALAGLEFLRRLVCERRLSQPSPWASDRTRVRGLWSSGQVAMAVHTPLMTRGGDVDLRIGPFPTSAGPATWQNVDCLVIPRDAPHKEAAIALLMLLYEDERHLDFCRTFMKMPVLRSVLVDPFFAEDRHLSRLVELLPQSRVAALHPRREAASVAALDAVGRMLQGEIGAGDVADRVRGGLGGANRE